jgi:hypothetical protein
MSFRCGDLISAVAYDLLEDGFQEDEIDHRVASTCCRLQPCRIVS